MNVVGRGIMKKGNLFLFWFADLMNTCKYNIYYLESMNSGGVLRNMNSHLVYSIVSLISWTDLEVATDKNYKNWVANCEAYRIGY